MADKTAPSASTRFFTWMRSLNIQREPGWIGGVAAGISTRLGIDPLIVRGIIVVVAILGGPALLVYAAAWLLLPDLDDKIHLERMLKGELEPPIAGIGVLVLLSLLPVSRGFWFAGPVWGEADWGGAFGRGLWTLVILGLVVWLIVWIARRPGLIPPMKPGMPASPPPPAANAPAADFAAWREQQAEWKKENTAFRQQQSAERTAAVRTMHEEQRAAWDARTAAMRERNRRSQPNVLFTILAIGLSLVAGGLTALWAGGGSLDARAVIAGLAAVLTVLALAMLVNGIRGKRAGGSAGLAALVVLPLIVLTVFPQNVHLQFAERTALAPVDSAQRGPDVYFASGKVDLNLEDFYPTSDDLYSMAVDAGGPATTIDDVYLIVTSGFVRVTLPDHYQSEVEAWAPSGGIRVGQPAEAVAYEEQGSSFSASYVPELFYDDVHKVVLHVIVLDGTITIATPKENSF